MQVPGRAGMERSILQRSVRYGLTTKLAFSARGSSRRITIMRIRPADIRVINRRAYLLSCLLLCRPRAQPDPSSNSTRFNLELDKVAPY